jgi:hypothetical protein
MPTQALHFSLSAKLWRWPGDMGWHFINLDKKISKEIRTMYPRGFVKISASIGNTKWNTSLFPHLESGVYILAIKKSVRKREELMDGDMVEVHFSLV